MDDRTTVLALFSQSHFIDEKKSSIKVVFIMVLSQNFDGSSLSTSNKKNSGLTLSVTDIFAL